jgi:hypothetical protein
MAWRLLSLKNTLARPAAWRSLLAVVTALALTASCSGDDEGRSPKKPAPPNPDTEWAVHVYVGEPGAWKRFDFGPVPEVSFPAGPFESAGALPASPADLWKGAPSPGAEGSDGEKSPGSKAQAVVDTKDGGVQIDQTLSTDPKSWALQNRRAAVGGNGRLGISVRLEHLLSAADELRPSRPSRRRSRRPPATIWCFTSAIGAGGCAASRRTRAPSSSA